MTIGNYVNRTSLCVLAAHAVWPSMLCGWDPWLQQGDDPSLSSLGALDKGGQLLEGLQAAASLSIQRHSGMAALVQETTPTRIASLP